MSLLIIPAYIVCIMFKFAPSIIIENLKFNLIVVSTKNQNLQYHNITYKSVNLKLSVSPFQLFHIIEILKFSKHKFTNL